MCRDPGDAIPLGGVQRWQSLVRVQRVKHFGPGRIDVCVNPYWVLPDALRVSGAGGFAAFFLKRLWKERRKMN